MYWFDSGGILMFFTDLDRTIIYSHRFVGKEPNPFHVTVEAINGKKISFMKLSSFTLLREMLKEGRVVPVSARNVEEIKRLSLFEEGRFPEWVICDNGLVVLRNGQPDLDWQQEIEKKEAFILRSRCYQIGVQHFKNLSDLFEKKWIKTNSTAYRVLIEDDPVFRETLYEQKEFYEKYGFLLDIQARKAYLIPKGFTKKEAVSYVIEHASPKKMIGAGDADSDYGFLTLMDVAYVPKHHSMTVLPTNAVITNEMGIRGGKEIIEDVLKRLYS